MHDGVVGHGPIGVNLEGKETVSESESPAAPDPWQSVPSQAAPGYGGYPPPGPGMMPPQYYYPGLQARRTNGLAIAAMVCGICGFLYLIPAILGIVFGVIAVRQINRDRTEGKTTDGKGMAIAGIATGVAWLVLVLVIILAVVAANN